MPSLIRRQSRRPEHAARSYTESARSAADDSTRRRLRAALAGAVASIPQSLAYGLIVGSALGGDYSGLGITDAMQTLKRTHSDIAFALLGNVTVIFAERLRATNSMLSELDA